MASRSPAWKDAFDRHDRARHEHNVLAYRISRPADDPGTVYIDLDFESRAEATGSAELLERIRQTPLSKSVATTQTPQMRELLEHHTRELTSGA